MNEERPSAGAVAMAWLVHAFTASGVVLGLLALVAVLEGNWTAALLWLLAALVVDGVDGSFARWAHVRTRAPRVEGATLDLIIDYLSYVFVPALLIWRAELVPPALGLPLAALILVSALYCFARIDMKTEDNYFRGFPALWNVVAFYLLVARPGPEAGAMIVVLLAALTFAPVHFIHPFRVRDFSLWPAVLATLWTLATAGLLWEGWSDELRGILLWLSSGTAVVLVALGLIRTFRGPAHGRSDVGTT